MNKKSADDFILLTTVFVTFKFEDMKRRIEFDIPGQ